MVSLWLLARSDGGHYQQTRPITRTSAGKRSFHICSLEILVVPDFINTRSPPPPFWFRNIANPGEPGGVAVTLQRVPNAGIFPGRERPD